MTHSALEAIDVEREPAAAGLAHERLGRYLLADFVLPEALLEYRAAAALLPERSLCSIQNPTTSSGCTPWERRARSVNANDLGPLDITGS